MEKRDADGEAHDDVPGGDRAEVVAVERGRDAPSEDQHADDLDEDRDAIEGVVGVARRGDQVKFIHAHQIAKNRSGNPLSASAA